VALEQTPSVRSTVIVAKRVGDRSRDESRARRVGWDDLTAGQPDNLRTRSVWTQKICCFLLYTSGTTAKPKGIMHTTGGYLTQVTATHKLDVRSQGRQRRLTGARADIGWVTGHSYIVYGPLAVMAQRASSTKVRPISPIRIGFWQIIVERYQASTIFYTAPTAIRTFMKWGDRVSSAKHDLSRRCGCWARKRRRANQSRSVVVVSREWIGNNNVVRSCDTWWHDGNGSHHDHAASRNFTTLLKPGSAHGRAFPGVQADIVDEKRQRLGSVGRRRVHR
jgi:acetyl-CoA synthetase